MGGFGTDVQNYHDELCPVDGVGTTSLPGRQATARHKTVVEQALGERG